MTNQEENPQELAVTEILSLIIDIQMIVKIIVPNLAGMQEAKYRLLGILEVNGSRSMTDLCNQMFISKTYMTRLVDSLVSEGSVERKPDEKDRRVNNISMTDQGRRNLLNLLTEMRNNLKPYLSGFSSSDLKQMCNTSKELHTTLSKTFSSMNQEVWSFYTSQDPQKKE